MFDIGFSELVVIAMVALIVIGPERLPRAARTLGHLFGRMQRYVNDVKSDISREMEIEDLRRLRETVEDAARSFQGSMEREISETRGEFQRIADAAGSAADEPPPTAPEVVAEEPARQLDLALGPGSGPAAGPDPAAAPAPRAEAGT